MSGDKLAIGATKRNLLGLFWALNTLDAALTLLALSRGAIEVNPLWTSYPIPYAMGFKLMLAFVVGLWFYLKGWRAALLAGSIWLTLAIVINLVTVTYLGWVAVE